MNHTQLFLAILMAVSFNTTLAASQISDEFLNEITGRWYITQKQEGYTGEITDYYPIPRDSVVIVHITDTDSIRITGYLNTQIISDNKFRVVWSNTFNTWVLSLNDHEIFIELSPVEFKVYQTENITTYRRITFVGTNLYEGNIDSAMTIMQGRWYLTAMGSGNFEIKENPVSGDSIIVSVIEDSDSLELNYYKNCLLDYSDTFRLVIDSSYSLQTDALMLVGNNEIDRILVSVSDSSMVLKTDSIPGHYLVIAPIDTFNFFKAPFVFKVTGDTACRAEDLALMAEADPGLVQWYTSSEGGSPVAHGNVFFPPDISETTTFYVDAMLNECVTPSRTPVIAVIKPVPVFTSLGDGARCGEGQLILTASSSEGVINWYADSMAAVATYTGESFQTPILDSTTVFYAEAMTNHCFSERMPVTALISYSDTCSVTTIGQFNDNNVVAFPNPTTGKFEVFLQNLNDHPHLVKIYNQSGSVRKEYRPRTLDQTVNIDITEFPEGIYFLIIQSDSNTRVIKILKQ